MPFKLLLSHHLLVTYDSVRQLHSDLNDYVRHLLVTSTIMSAASSDDLNDYVRQLGDFSDFFRQLLVTSARDTDPEQLILLLYSFKKVKKALSLKAKMFIFAAIPRKVFGTAEKTFSDSESANDS